MIESHNPEIDVHELMARIRAEVQRRKAQLPVYPSGPPAMPPAGAPEAITPTFHRLRTNVTEALDRARQKDHVSSRIPAVIRPFFRNQGGFNFQLLHAIELQTQQIDALCDQLASRRDVAELRAALVDTVNHIKVLQEKTSDQGDELANLQQAIRVEVAELRTALADSLNHIKTLQEKTSDQRDELANLQQAVRGEVAELRTALAENLNQIKTLQEKTSKQVSGAHGILKQQQAQYAAAHQQIRALDSRLAEFIDRVAPKITSVDGDAFYLAFENQFRGSREDIKERQRIYLPYLAEAGVGTVDKPLLDLGCGRGEWLEILRENGYTARGVDTNVSMVSLCRELGLDVEQYDALACLRLLPANSQGAVTGFHIIEHLAFPVMLELFAVSYRVLRPGGLAIFETPNPQNLIVGACNFHFDPTHLRPLPPELVQFSLLQVGFTHTELKKLHPYPLLPSQQAKDDVETEILGFLRREQDFAIIGHK